MNSQEEKDTADLIELLSILKFDRYEQGDMTLVEAAQQHIDRLATTTLLRGYAIGCHEMLENTRGYSVSVAEM